MGMKLSIFRVVTRSEIWNGIANTIEVGLTEDDAAADATPISVVFRQLTDESARDFPTGTRVTISIGGDPAPPKAIEPVPSLLSRLGAFIVGTPTDPSVPS